ncbi:MAG: UvrD-helicase domain-containing protein [Gemmatimonadota bacterium]|nr:UvrD-helicase domain-containing protein [Gemmatimonadota bacterium]
MAIATDDTLLEGLNSAQREAVLRIDGPLLVLAGAGSGKTRVLTTRLARIIDHHGIDPSQILAVTFTNKAAGEMKQRIGRLLGRSPMGMWVGTFHAIGARMLRAAPHLVGRTPSFTIYDQDDAQTVVKRIMERLQFNTKQFTPRGVHSAISDAKNALVLPTEYANLAMDPFARAIAKVYPEYGEELRRANAVDFDDLLLLPVQMLGNNARELEKYQRRFKYILVDEYQDTNRAQYMLVKHLAGGHGNLCVVGDDDQSIYGWRGADIRNILDFQKDFPDAHIVRLEENYRSTPEVLDLANVVISANTGRMGKTLRPTRGSGERVTAARCLDERDEADYVVERITERSGQGKGGLRDFAIVYRTNSQSRALEEALRKRAVPYRLVGSVRFYDRREVRDLMSYLKLIANPADDEAFRRAVAVPKRGLGDTTIEQLSLVAREAGVPMLAAAVRPDLIATIRPAARAALAEFAGLLSRFRESAREAGVDELLREIVEGIRYDEYLKAEGAEGADRIENVKELITGAAELVSDEEGEVGLTPLDHFLQKAMLVAELDKLGPDADAVTMMTLHNAKGLEFPVVFITGLEDGLFPLAKAFDDPAMLEEERRLFYVGITRAERKLFLTHAEERRRNGEFMPAKASSFLQAIPEAMLEQYKTIKVRSSGRSFMQSLGGGSQWGNSRARGVDHPARETWLDAESAFPPSASQRRPGLPVTRVAAFTEAEESQDAAIIAVGSRVKHRKFGSGVIAELAGAGRDLKAKIDFDDEAIGRKTLVVAQANLERVSE